MPRKPKTPAIPVQQDADMSQTNDQKVDQGNTQDASHRSQVMVTVQNHMTPGAHPAPAGRIDGRVLDGTGNGIPDCIVQVFFGPLVGVPVAVEETDRYGRFRVASLPPGYYSLRALGSNLGIAEFWNLRVDVGSETRPVISLPPAVGHLHPSVLTRMGLE